MRFLTIVTTLIWITGLVACQQDRQVPKNAPSAVLGAPQSGGSGTEASSTPSTSTSGNRTVDAQVATDSSNVDVERKRFENTIQTTPVDTENQQTNQRDSMNLDLSKLQSTRKRNQKIMRKLRESKNEWPEKFDDQAAGRLEKHMQSQGWSNFEVDENTEDRTSGDHQSEFDDDSVGGAEPDIERSGDHQSEFDDDH